MKFFITSDIHSFYTPMIEALNKAGFDKNNSNHWLITCGDNFDRGNESQKVLDYLLSLPQKTLIKGNHEDLIVECCNRGYPEWRDGSNGTIKTIRELGHEKNSFELACEITLNKLKPLLSQMVDYFETKNYVFVHSFIPYEQDNWRNCLPKDWKKARWHNPYKLCGQGYWKEDKILVFGHWHTSGQWSKYMHTPEYDEGAIYDTFIGDNYIGLDACTALSNQVNVYVMEDEFND